MANIHLQSNRYTDAITCFRKAVEISELALMETLQSDSLEAFYCIKPLKGWCTVKSLPLPSHIKEIRKTAPLRNKVYVNMKNKKLYERIHANRLFQFANCLMLQCKFERDRFVQLQILEEVIDRLRMVEKIESEH